MAKINTLTYNGTKSSDLGVFVSGSGSFDAAEFDVDKYEIPGRNGDLILSNDRYKNIEITYPAFIPKAFMDKVQNVRNWLRSSKVYARLEDTYDMDHYRLGIPTGVQSFSPENRNDGANFEMTFDCKPQRFLKVGETPETVEADVQTETGEIVTFETVAESPITSASVSLSPIQSLNGYDSPWPGGGGVNKLPKLVAGTYEANGGKIVVDNNGLATFSGTTTASGNVAIIPLETPLLVSARWYAQFHNTVRMVQVSANFESTAHVSALDAAFTSENRIVQIAEADVGKTIDQVRFWTPSGTTLSGTFQPMFTEEATATAFSPYENTCPISGHDGADLIRTGGNLLGITVTDRVESGITITQLADGGIKVNGTAVGNVRVNIPATTYAPSKLYAGQPYTLSGSLGRPVSDAYLQLIYTDEVTGQLVSIVTTERPTTYTPTHDCLYNSTYMNVVIGKTFNNEVFYPMLNFGSSAEAYEPYHGDTYSVTFTDQGTVYGGTYDFVSGKLRVTWAAKTYNGSETWYPYGTQGYYIPNDAVAKTSSASSAGRGYVGYIICDKLKTYSSNYFGTYQSAEYGITAWDNVESVDKNWLYIKVGTVSAVDGATVRAWLAENPITVTYVLATPIEYTLSPQQLTTLQGQNVVWGNGTVTLTYAEPYNINNPTLFDARPLFTVTNPAEGDVIMVNGQAITFVDGYTGTVYIDCETMNAFSGAANLNSIIQATDFPVLVPGTNIVTWTGAGECTMTPRWWEL